jgi:hypothetical protein
MYLDRRGRPRRLKFSEAGIEFLHLVKKYSGDIPARAMLEEMMRLGLVTQSDSGTISLIRNVPELPVSAVATVGAIAPWVNLVAQAGGDRSSKQMTSHTQQISVFFKSLSEVMAAVRELDSRQRSFVAGIQQLGTSTKQTGECEVTVSVAVATTRPSIHSQRELKGDAHEPISTRRRTPKGNRRGPRSTI